MNASVPASLCETASPSDTSGRDSSSRTSRFSGVVFEVRSMTAASASSVAASFAAITLSRTSTICRSRVSISFDSSGVGSLFVSRARWRNSRPSRSRKSFSSSTCLFTTYTSSLARPHTQRCTDQLFLLGGEAIFAPRSRPAHRAEVLNATSPRKARPPPGDLIGSPFGRPASCSAP